ncbi:hypothetical protein F5884DRAFT_865459 [Xylogone sp. PMI_703]|nr:hypothetical protein F5884DRAFT_865459 [Xylogone sp. PMI_703]
MAPNFLSKLRSRKLKDSKKPEREYGASSDSASSVSQSTTISKPPLTDATYVHTSQADASIASLNGDTEPSVHGSQLLQSPVPPLPTTSQTTISSQVGASSSPLNISERLWNKAYDDIKQEESKLVDAYERLLSQELKTSDSDLEQLQRDENSIEQIDKVKRWSQMEQLVQTSLKKTERESEMKRTAGIFLQGFLSLKAGVGTALGAIPQAALPWAGVCFVMQMFFNPVAETKANRDGIIYVISRMDWYCQLSIILLKENTVDLETFAQIQSELEKRIVSLYQALLLYLMKSVCSCYRNRFAAFLRDTVKLDDWDGSLRSVEVAENALRQDLNTYTTQKIVNQLDHLLRAVTEQGLRLLQDIYRALEQHISLQINAKDYECIQHLRLTDPQDDKARIEDTKGGLLQDSYCWILENSEFQQWCTRTQGQLLWIRGDPGKGKTMLLCGIVNELNKSKSQVDSLSYFFCQATDTRLNSATAVLRGLVYLLVKQRPSLVSHIQKKYNDSGKALFEDVNAWIAITDVLKSILRDPSLKNICLIIDALDECVTGLPQLLGFIAEESCPSSHAKWIVSSRNWPGIEEGLRLAKSNVQLRLELNAESVSVALRKYIEHKLLQLKQQKGYDDKTQQTVSAHLKANANSTFLRVALVCQNLESAEQWEAIEVLNESPPGLDALYARMMKHICNAISAKLYKQILATISVIFRPITVRELASLIEKLKGESNNSELLEKIVNSCGSFLTLRKGTIYFVHQSAKDYLLGKGSNDIFPFGIREAHCAIFSRSLEAMSKVLKRDIYGLRALGCSIEQAIPPNPDPLDTIRYSCVYWVDHLFDYLDGSGKLEDGLRDNGIVHEFLQRRFIYWLEALSLCRSMSKGVLSVTKLGDLIQRANAPQLLELIRDTRRFIMYYKQIIEDYPLQLYSSALLFSPVNSLVKGLFREEEPKWITILPGIRDQWDACLQTLEGHTDTIWSVVFYDSTKLASASCDATIRIWDVTSGTCLQTLNGHNYSVRSIVISQDGTKLASGSTDKKVKVWDLENGRCLRTLEGHDRAVELVVFSDNSTRLASMSSKTVRIWDTNSGVCLLAFHSQGVLEVKEPEVLVYGYASYYDDRSIAFSHDLAQFASISDIEKIRIFDTNSGKCLQTLEGHDDAVKSIIFSHDSTQLASSSRDKTVKVWDASSGKCLRMYDNRTDSVNFVVFSHDSKWLASTSDDGTARIWDVESGECLQTLETPGYSAVFSPDSVRFATFIETTDIPVIKA